MSTLDPKLTQQLADEGISTVDANANVLWKRAAFDAGVECACIYHEFIADQVWEQLEKDGCVEYIHNKSAMGPVMLSLAKAGFITPTGVFKKSIRPATHGRPLPVWRSSLLGD